MMENCSIQCCIFICIVGCTGESRCIYIYIYIYQAQTHNKEHDKNKRIKCRAHGTEWLTWYGISNSLIVERENAFVDY